MLEHVRSMDLNPIESVPKKRSRSKMRGDVYEMSESDQNKSDSAVDSEHSDYVKGDEWNIALLLFLYLLQGIPLGLSAAIPIILQNRKVNYSDQVRDSLIDLFRCLCQA